MPTLLIMPTILIVHATQMGSTAEIAHAIGAQLAARGAQVSVASAHEAPDPSAFDAVIVGSALYVGRWLPDAVRFLARHRPTLLGRAVFLFQSGPCGDGAESMQAEVPRRVRRLAAAISAAPPTTFGGVLDRARTSGRLSRWMASGPLAGDFRDWDRIEEWADSIGDRLGLRPTASSVAGGPESGPGTEADPRR